MASQVKGIHRVKKTLSGGRKVEYHYAWRGGPRFWDSKTAIQKGGAGYWAAYHEAVQSRRSDTGQFRQVIVDFLESREFASKAERTRKDYEKSIRHPQGIDATFGDAPIAAFNRPEIRRVAYTWRDKFASPRVADHFKGHLSAIVSWAVDRAYIHQNHLAGMSNLYSSDRSDLIWTPDEIALFLDGDAERRVDPAPTHLRRLFTTALETGLRPGDIRILSRAHIQATEKGRRIYIRTAKRKRFVSIPVTEAMGRVIDTTPKGQLQIIVGERGQPYAQTPSLGQAVSRRRDECGIRKELQLRDTRGTAATRLFEADATLREIAAHMGWSVAHTAKMIETYVRMNPDASDRLLIRLQSTGV